MKRSWVYTGRERGRIALDSLRGGKDANLQNGQAAKIDAVDIIYLFFQFLSKKKIIEIYLIQKGRTTKRRDAV